MKVQDCSADISVTCLGEEVGEAILGVSAVEFNEIKDNPDAVNELA